MANKETSTKRLHATVHGRVQGVNFRAYTRRRADELNLEGWVRNKPGGAVETIAEGTQEALEQFLEFLHTGSPAAAVSRIEAVWGDASNEFSGFNVRYL
jgi:acylphosphatase